MDSKTMERFKALLEEKRKLLMESFQEKIARTHEEKDGAMDEVDQASHLYNKEFWYSLSDQDRQVLKLVEQALEKINAKEFGECEHCGDNIQKRRLEAVPWARHCIGCQELQERGLLEDVPVEVPRSKER